MVKTVNHMSLTELQQAEAEKMWFESDAAKQRWIQKRTKAILHKRKYRRLKRPVGTHGYRKPKEIESHDDLKGLYLITDTEQNSLIDGIGSDGFLEDRPLMLFKGPWTEGKEVLGDGHTRLKAAIQNGLKSVPVVVHEVETLQDAVSMIFGVDYRQRKRYETIHLIHLLKKIQSMESSISDAGKKPKGKLSGLLARWIGTSQATVERLQSILKNPDAVAYIDNHKDEKLSILKIYDMFKDKDGSQGQGPSAPKGPGEQTPPVPPVGGKHKECFGNYPEEIRPECMLCPEEGKCEEATHPPSGQGETPIEPTERKSNCMTLGSSEEQQEENPEEEPVAPASGQGETPIEPKEQKKNCITFGAYDPETCIKDCKDLEQCKAKTEAENVPQSPEEQPENPEEEPTPPSNDIQQKEAVSTVSQAAPPEDFQELSDENEDEPTTKMVPIRFAEFLERLPEWMFKFLDANPKEVSSARWIMIGEGSTPDVSDNAMIQTDPDNPPPSRAEEKKATKKGLSKQEIKKLANKEASEVNEATGEGKKTLEEQRHDIH